MFKKRERMKVASVRLSEKEIVSIKKAAKRYKITPSVYKRGSIIKQLVADGFNVQE